MLYRMTKVDVFCLIDKDGHIFFFYLATSGDGEWWCLKTNGGY